jgi:hypothetical protein
MRRKITIALLALGTLTGYGSSLAHVVHRHCAECARWRSDSR